MDVTIHKRHRLEKHIRALFLDKIPYKAHQRTIYAEVECASGLRLLAYLESFPIDTVMLHNDALAWYAKFDDFVS